MRRYQVFVSSTFKDLHQERESVTQTLLGADYIPVGMELFGAAPVSSWDVITKTIDISDFYVLIIGFRYGEVKEGTGKSYTECEYDYALTKGIPILVFIQDRNAPVSNTNREGDARKAKKLEAFIDKVKHSSQCAFWKDIHDLPVSVIMSLTKTRATAQRPGWFRFPQQVLSASTNRAYVIISAHKDYSTKIMYEDAESRNADFSRDFAAGASVLKWDLGALLGEDGHRVGSILDSHIPVINHFLTEQLNTLGGISHLCVLYAGPTGLAFHIGCLFANIGRNVEIYQHGKESYVYFGVLPK